MRDPLEFSLSPKCISFVGKLQRRGQCDWPVRPRVFRAASRIMHGDPPLNIRRVAHVKRTVATAGHIDEVLAVDLFPSHILALLLRLLGGSKLSRIGEDACGALRLLLPTIQARWFCSGHLPLFVPRLPGSIRENVAEVAQLTVQRIAECLNSLETERAWCAVD